MNGINRYLNRLYDRTVADQDRLDSEKLREVLGHFQQTKPGESGVIEETVDCECYLRQRVFFTSVDEMTVPMYVLTPKHAPSDRRMSIVLALHGHGYGSREMVGLYQDGSPRYTPTSHNDWAVQLVKEGFKVFVPEMIGLGDRKLEADREKANSCYTLAVHHLMAGKTLAGLRTFEAQIALDYIKETYPEAKIGVVGFSGGGLIATLLSVLDDRVKATVLSGYPNTFKGSVLATVHCLDNYIPGLLRLAEMPELIGMIAPKPLFIEAGEGDEVFPSRHAHLAIERIRSIYNTESKDSVFESECFQGGHEVSGGSSTAWLKKQLM
ncbi:Alpha/beta hydrolase family protein [Halobacillus dabanensis]|uniref:Alpha/beta hydrolase family protein n=1 Tax=Halobacillus dabanensis TaxID=240302 RepID=A0A1I3RX38_HALDA|nr:dienelactone hydrolase family protein [Halobacillus dabanensis]SFJ49887.1 Alpha/beta hydrolase family protein [Halobacillus dabanensis]